MNKLQDIWGNTEVGRTTHGIINAVQYKKPWFEVEDHAADDRSWTYGRLIQPFRSQRYEWNLQLWCGRRGCRTHRDQMHKATRLDARYTHWIDWRKGSKHTYSQK